MSFRTADRATFAEVFSSIKFSRKPSVAPAHPWPATGFAVNKSNRYSTGATDEQKLVRSSN